MSELDRIALRDEMIAILVRRVGVSRAGDLVDAVLPTVQREIDIARADAWDEGWNASANYMHVDYDGPDDPDNPYRQHAEEKST